MASSSELVGLNVGGISYSTTRSTLTKHPGTMLSTMFTSNLTPAIKDKDDRYFIDRNGEMFGIILEYLRSGKVTVSNDFKEFQLLKQEVYYYQVPRMMEKVEKMEERLREEEFKLPFDVRDLVTCYTNKVEQQVIMSGTEDTFRHFTERSERCGMTRCRSDGNGIRFLYKDTNSPLKQGFHHVIMVRNRFDLIGRNKTEDVEYWAKSSPSVKAYALKNRLHH